MDAASSQMVHAYLHSAVAFILEAAQFANQITLPKESEWSDSPPLTYVAEHSNRSHWCVCCGQRSDETGADAGWQFASCPTASANSPWLARCPDCAHSDSDSDETPDNKTAATTTTQRPKYKATRRRAKRTTKRRIAAPRSRTAKKKKKPTAKPRLRQQATRTSRPKAAAPAPSTGTRRSARLVNKHAAMATAQ